MQQPDLSCESTYPITFGDLDPMGIVWHGNYFSFFESGREAWGRKHHLDAMFMYENGVFTPIVRSVIDHKAMLSYGDTALIRTEYVPTPAAKIILRYVVTSELKNAIVATGETVQVFLDKDKQLLLDPPEVYKAWRQRNGMS
jgi:acyl-CoA thioester hydrolase